MKNPKKNKPNNLLSIALDYAERGFSITPVDKGKKSPSIRWKKYQKETPSEDQIEKWFEKTSDRGIAIITGAVSGIVVVDVEKDGKIDDLPETVHCRTGGGGHHFYYSYDNTRPIGSHTKIRELTDIRGDGGCVIAPPSLHASGDCYEWIIAPGEMELAEFPYWLLEKEPLGKEEKPKKKKSDWQKITTDPVSEGQRNHTATKLSGKLIKDLAKPLHETVGWRALKDWNQRCCIPPLPEKELRKTWESIKNINEQEGNQRETKKKAQEIYSSRLPNGVIVETYYDPERRNTGFLVCEDGEITKKASVDFEGTTFLPTPAKNSLIAKGFVKLASDAIPYGSETKLLDIIQKFIHKYVQIPPEFERITTFYVLLSWVYDEFEEIPYLRVIGDYGSGKSRFLKAIGALGYKSVFLNGAASSSAIFRMIDNIKGIVIIDEADFRHSDTTNELVKILNSGFQKGMPVFRSEAKTGREKSFDPTPFDVFCPKVIATRQEFRDEALESRCLSSSMQVLTRDDIAENLDESFEKEAQLIRNQLMTFRLERISQGISLQRLPKLEIEPRLKQIITPMYSIVKSDKGKKQILEFIEHKQDEVYEQRFSSSEGQLLRALLKVRKKDPEPMLKDIVWEYNESFAGKYPIKERKAGEVIDRIFHLQKKRQRNGTVILNTPDNEERLQKLILKFGVNKPSVNEVNVVNVDQEKGITKEDVRQLFGDDAAESMSSSS